MTQPARAHNAAPLNETANTRLKRTKYGLMQYFSHDKYVGRSLDIYGEFSDSEICLFRQLVSPGDVVVEVGANIGCHTVFLAQAVGHDGLVYAVEPQRHVFQMLCGNLALNEILNVVALPCAFGEKAGQADIPVLELAVENNLGGVSLNMHTAGATEKVDVKPLDELGLERLDFLKIDVEGFENEVLLGAKETIHRCRPLIYVENDRQEKSRQLIQTLWALGYRLYWHHPVLFNPNNYYGEADNVLVEAGGQITVSINMLCVPREIEGAIDGLKAVESDQDKILDPSYPLHFSF